MANKVNTHNIKNRWRYLNKEKRRYELVIHIGMEKTGTTSIQHWLVANKQYIENEGWCLPLELGKYNHRKVVYLGFENWMRDDGTLRRNIQTDEGLKIFKQKVRYTLQDEFKRCKLTGKTMIISSELASSRLTENQTIDNFLQEFRYCGFERVLVVLFRRDPGDIMESRYTTSVKHEGWDKQIPPEPHTEEANKFCDQERIQDLEKNACKYGFAIEIYQYSKKALIDGNIVDTVALLMGIEDYKKEKEVNMNTKEYKIKLKILAYLNKLIKILESKELTMLLRMIKKVWQVVDEYMNFGPRYKCKESYKERIRNYYKESVLRDKGKLVLTEKDS